MTADDTRSWSEDDLETATCPLCGPAPGVQVRFDFSPFRIVACNGCSLQFLSPRLTEARMLGLYQEPGYFRSNVPGHGYDEYLEARPHWHRSFMRRLRQIQRHGSGRRLLDVGCGPGFLLEAATRMGYDVRGIDPSAYVVAIAQETFGPRVRQGTIHTADFESARFDVVVAFDTFEHVYDPLRFLDAARDLLKPGGVLAITTPDPTSLLARVSGRRWVSFKIPEHVFYWSRGPMARALEDRFSILETTRAGQYASLSFLVRRLFGLRPMTGGLGKLLLEALGRFTVYADNGSFTVIAARS